MKKVNVCTVLGFLCYRLWSCLTGHGAPSALGTTGRILPRYLAAARARDWGRTDSGWVAEVAGTCIHSIQYTRICMHGYNIRNSFEGSRGNTHCIKGERGGGISPAFDMLRTSVILAS